MFLTIPDLNTTLYPEIRQLLSRYDEGTITAALASAESEMESYICLRYDSRFALNKTGADRHTLLLTYGRDIAIFRLYQLAETIPAHRERAYDRAIAALELIASGKIGLPGVPAAPVPPTVANSGGIAYGGPPKRVSLDSLFMAPPLIPV